MFFGKRKDRATKASALMESIRQSVGSAGSTSEPTSMPARTVPPGAPTLIVRPPPVDSSSTGSPSSTLMPKSSRRIVGSARLKVRNPTGKLSMCAPWCLFNYYEFSNFLTFQVLMFCMYIHCRSGPEEEVGFMFWKEGGGYRSTNGAEDQAGVFPV